MDPKEDPKLLEEVSKSNLEFLAAEEEKDKKAKNRN
jgi:hypothetical protein